MVTSVQITFDCADPDRLARFWADALGYQLQPPPDGYATWEDFLRAMGVPEEEWGDGSAIVDPDGSGPRFYFQRVPEPKTAKNRLHLDLNAAHRGMPIAERHAAVDRVVERLLGLGAQELYRMEEPNHYHVTMADPEGNEFCVH